jgi:hypothetical protein
VPCPAVTYPDLESATEAAATARIRRALKGRRTGGTTTTAHFCHHCSRWHLSNTSTRKATR